MLDNKSTTDQVGRLDHSISSEYRILGPPGTGKTTSISKLVREAAKRYGGNSVLVTSFSRGAAAELANCDLTIPPERLGTLHSICFHALGRPLIAEAHVKDWNRIHPQWALTPVKRELRLSGQDAVEEWTAMQHGDSLLQSINRHRGLMIDSDVWPTDILTFNRAWTDYKKQAGLMDFCDLIEHCLHDVPVAPGSPAVIFADEAQDLNPLQARLLRRWCRNADYLVLAGDDDQTIYSFLGASPDVLLQPAIPDDHRVILTQSHRLPIAIHRLADSIIRGVSHRQEKLYFAEDRPGSVHRLASGSYKSPEYSILTSATQHLGRGQTIMFLASCSYMLEPIVQVLRKNAIPFHNPYREANGFWNPLKLGHKTAARRLISLLLAHPRYGNGQRAWNFGDLQLWTEWLIENAVLKAGVQTILAGTDRRQTVTLEELSEFFTTEALASLLATFDGSWRQLMEWWRAGLVSEVRARVQFPADVALKYGPQKLVQEPSIVVGTVHSVKGGEADVVYLFPDLSRAGYLQYERPGRERDSVLRLFYVGATRAREMLYIAQRESAKAVCI